MSVPDGYILISTAVHRLKAGMFVGRRPEPVRKLQAEEPHLRVGFGPPQEQAAKILSDAICSGDLAAYVRDEANSADHAGIDAATAILPVSPPALRALARRRGGLPDYPIRPSFSLLRKGQATVETFTALTRNPLLLRETDFSNWYRRIVSLGVV